MKKFLSLILLLTMLLTIPVAEAASTEVALDSLSTLFDSNWFWDLNRTVKNLNVDVLDAHTYVYNGSNIENSVELGGIAYSLTGLDGTANDSYLVSSNSDGLTLTIPKENGEYVEYNKIGFIAVAPTEITVAPLILYKGNTVATATANISIKPANVASESKISAGNALQKSTTGLTRKTITVENYAMYLNSYVILPETFEFDSVQFPAATSDYYVIAVTTVPYVFDSAAVKSVIDTHYANYLGQAVDFTAFTDTDTENIQTLKETLESLKSAADDDLTTELLPYKATAATDMETLDKLVLANEIYNEKYPIYTAIQDLYSNKVNSKTYLEIAEDIENAPFNAFSSDVATHLSSIISEYQKAIGKEDSWSDYSDLCSEFGVTDNCVIDTAEKAKIEALKTAYEEYLDAEEENSAARAALTTLLSSSEISGLTAGTTAFTSAQSAKLREAEKQLAILTENGADTSSYATLISFIEALNSDKSLIYGTRTDDAFAYDILLDNFFNSDKIATVGDYVVKENSLHMTSATLTVKDNYATMRRYCKLNAAGTDVEFENDIKMYFNAETLRAGVNDNINLLAGESVTIPVVNVNTSHIKFVVGSAAEYKITYNYTDNTSSTFNISNLHIYSYGARAADRLTAYNDFVKNGYGILGYNPDYNNIPTYTKVVTEGDANFGKYLVGKVKNTGSRVGTIVLQVPVDCTRILDSVTFTIAGNNSAYIYSLSQHEISTSDITSYLTSLDKTTLEPTDGIFTHTQMEQLNTAEAYLEILEKRGESVAAYSYIKSLIQQAATQKPASETVRTGINTVESTINFGAIVTDYTGITVKKNGAAITSGYSIASSNDGFSAVVTISESKNGGNVYEITVPASCSAIGYADEVYTYSYTVPDYYTYSYTGGTFTITNNSTDGKDNYYGALTAIDSNGIAVKATYQDKNTTADSVSTSLGTLNTVLWNDIMQTISNDTEIAACTAMEVSGADYNNPVLNLATNVIKVSGYTASAASGKVVNLRLNKAGYNGDLLYAGTIKTGTNGYFEFNITLAEPLSGNGYDIYFNLGGDDYNAIHQIANTVYICSASDKESYISDLKSGTVAASDIETLKDALAVDFEPANTLTDAEFASYLNENKADFTGLTISDIGEIQTTIKTLSILAVFEKETAEAENALFNGTAFKHDDIIGYSGIDSNGATLWSIYNNSISLTGQEAVKDALLGESYADTAALLEAVKEQIFINALKNPPVDAGGTAYITNLLTTANDTALKNISYSKFNGTSAFIDAIATAIPTFTTASDVASFIANYTPTTTNPGGNQGGGNLGGGGGGGSWNSGMSFDTVDIPLDDSQPVAPAEKTSIFTDVSADHWAYVNIVSLFDKKIISGKALGIFAPDDSLTRGELVKMLCTAYNLKALGGSPFADTNEKWYNEYAAAAFENGLVKGISETEFGGDAPITRQDLCTILYRIKNEAVTTELTFTDSDSVSEYAVSAVAYMNSKQIISGFTDGSFRPNEICSRAQCAKIIDLFLNLQ